MENLGIIPFFPVPTLSLSEAGKVHINNLDKTLERFGIALTEEELAKLSEDSSGNPLQSSCLENPMDGGAW